LLGLGRAGAYHLERIGVRQDLQIVAACAADAEDDSPHPLCRNVLPRIDDLLSRDDLDSILIAAPPELRGRLTLQSLEAGKNVAVETPPCRDGQEARRLLASARRAGRSLCVLSSRREGLDFRAARQVTVGGELGTIEAARIVSWMKAVPAEDVPPVHDERSTDDTSTATFRFFAFQYVDQLLQLIGRPAQTVFARIPNQPASDPTATAFLITVGFGAGIDGLIDVNLHSGAALHTGWMLAGTKGAYCQQRTWIAEPSGEICDIPVVPAKILPIDPYAALSSVGCSGDDVLCSAWEAVAVMDVIDASLESSRRGEVVRLPAIDTRG
jgi:predicted dehydrogenase